MKRWTPSEDATLRELYSQGVPLRDIAKRMKRTRPSIQGRLAKKGIYGGRVAERRPWTREEMDFLIAHYRQPGWTGRQIADHLGRSIKTVRGKAKYFGLTDPNRDYKTKPPGTDERIITLAMADTPTSEIAREVDCHESYVWLVIKHRPSLYRRWIRNTAERKSTAMAKAHAEGRHPGPGWRKSCD